MSQASSSTPSFGMQRQFEIYLAGLQKQYPSQAVAIEELRDAAREKLSKEAYGYLEGSAGSEDTEVQNRVAFQDWRIVPRFLRGIENRDLSVEILYQKFSVPFLLAPIGVQTILHPEGEIASAKAAASVGVPYVFSTASTHPMEAVAEAMGDSPRWFQLYWSRHREFTASLLQRAEKAGYSAIIVTLDTFQLAWRERDIQNAYLPFLLGQGVGNYFSDPVFRGALEKPPEEDPQAAIQLFAQIFSDPGLTWEDLAFLRENTSLPILLKGILHPGDAQKAVDHGMDGVVVSNHGGRQVDGAISALGALPGVVDAVGDKTTILFDSGIRRAADAFKAMALGAKAVLLGRPYAYGLAVGGEEGVRQVLLNFKADLDLTLGLAGCRTWEQVTREMVREL